MVDRKELAEVYDRVQETILVKHLDREIIADWLVGSSTKLSDLIEQKAIDELLPKINEAETADEFEELETIRIDELLPKIKERRTEVEVELVDDVKTIIDEGSFRDAVDKLRELNPRRFGGIRSGETRRAKAGFRVLFG